MNIIEVMHLTAGEVHEAINDYVKKLSGKMAGRIEFEPTSGGHPICFTNSQAAIVELHNPPTKD